MPSLATRRIVRLHPGHSGGLLYRSDAGRTTAPQEQSIADAPPARCYSRPVTDHTRLLIFAISAAIVIGVISVVLGAGEAVLVGLVLPSVDREPRPGHLVESVGGVT